MNLLKLTFALACLALQAPVFAHGDAHHGVSPAHASHGAEQLSFGRPGDASQVTRTVHLTMTDDMRFTPDRIDVSQGETIRLVVANKGQVLHEMVLGSSEDLARHAREMREHPGMAHEQPYMAHVDPGATGKLVWHFNRAGTVDFGCLLPGHFEAGMSGKAVVR